MWIRHVLELFLFAFIKLLLSEAVWLWSLMWVTGVNSQSHIWKESLNACCYIISSSYPVHHDLFTKCGGIFYLIYVIMHVKEPWCRKCRALFPGDRPLSIVSLYHHNKKPEAPNWYANKPIRVHLHDYTGTRTSQYWYIDKPILVQPQTYTGTATNLYWYTHILRKIRFK